MHITLKKYYISIIMRKQKQVQIPDSVWKRSKRAAIKANTTRPKYITKAIEDQADRDGVK